MPFHSAQCLKMTQKVSFFQERKKNETCKVIFKHCDFYFGTSNYVFPSAKIKSIAELQLTWNVFLLFLLHTSAMLFNLCSHSFFLGFLCGISRP